MADLTTVECANYGIIIHVTDSFNKQRREDKKSFYCPNGHGNIYRRSTSDELRDTLAEKNNKIADLEKELIKKGNKKKK